MHIRTIVHNNVVIARLETDEVLIHDVDSALDLLSSVHYETGSRRLILDSTALDARFFDLKTRMAGEILQKFVTYQMKLAIVGDYSVYHSKSLADFIRESNAGRDIYFVSSEEEAVTRLSR